MCKLLLCLAEVKNQPTFDLLKDTVINIMKEICEAAEFMTEYLGWNVLGGSYLTFPTFKFNKLEL
jgi:hypothetical protein